MRRSLGPAWILAGLTLGPIACTPPVPPQSVALSEAVGERISVTQASHEAFLAQYFASSRARVEDFLQQRWIPRFLANFTADSQLMEALTDSALVGPSADQERGALVLDFASAAIAEIEDQRRSLLRPIDRLEREALAELRASYADLQAMNASITAYLASTQKISETQDDVLRRLHLLQSRDAALEKAVRLSDRIDRVLDAAGEIETIHAQLQRVVSDLDLGPGEE